MYTQVEDLEKILVMNKLKYKKEIAIKELNNKRFDYYLPKHKLFIEFDGAQHHYPVEHFGGNDRYIQQVFDDAEKTMWCKHNGYKFLRLNHLMSMETMINLINDVIEMETKLYINESDVMLPYIDEWCELNLNQRDLYIKELFDDYNIYLISIMGNNYKINDIEPFEIYIINYSKNIEYKGIIKKKKKYTKYYINHDFEEKVNVNNLAENDIFELFIKHLDEIGIFQYTKIPSKLIYIYYKNWFKNNDFYKEKEKLKVRKFANKLNKKLKKLGYTNVIYNNRMKTIKDNEFNKKLLLDKINNDKIKTEYLYLIDINANTTVYNKVIN